MLQVVLRLALVHLHRHEAGSAAAGSHSTMSVLSCHRSGCLTRLLEVLGTASHYSEPVKIRISCRRRDRFELSILLHNLTFLVDIIQGRFECGRFCQASWVLEPGGIPTTLLSE